MIIELTWQPLQVRMRKVLNHWSGIRSIPARYSQKAKKSKKRPRRVVSYIDPDVSNDDITNRQARIDGDLDAFRGGLEKSSAMPETTKFALSATESDK